MCIKYTLCPHYPAVVLRVSLSRFRSSDTGASGIQCWCASMSDFMPLKLKGSWTPDVSRTCFACTESSFQKFKTSWTGTTRRCECRKNQRAPETQTTRPVRAHEWWLRGRICHPPNGPFVTCTITFDQACRLLMLDMLWKALDRALNMSQGAAQGDTALQALLGRFL